MEINIRRTTLYNHIVLNIDGTKVDMGLFGRKESLEIAKEFILAAEMLLPADLSTIECQLMDAREAIKKEYE